MGIMQIAFSQDKKSDVKATNKVKDIRDSVNIILSMPESKDKANYLSRLGDIYRFSNADSAIFYFSLSEKMALKLNYEEFLPTVHQDLSFVYSRLKSNYSRSLYYAILSKKDHEAIGIFDPSHDFNIMQEYAYMGSKTKVEKLLEIIKPAVISGNFKTNTLSKVTLLGLIGEAYLKINELDSALKYSSWGLRIPEKNKWPYIYSVSYTHLTLPTKRIV